MRTYLGSGIAALLLFLGVVSTAAAATSDATSTEVKKGTCTVDLPGYGR